MPVRALVTVQPVLVKSESPNTLNCGRNGEKCIGIKEFESCYIKKSVGKTAECYKKKNSPIKG